MRWPQARGSAKQVGLIGLILFIGALLFIPAGSTLVAHGGSYSFAAQPRWSSLFGTFVWVPAVAGLLAGLCVAGTIGSRTASQSDSVAGSLTPVSREVAVLLAGWVLVPLLVLFVVATTTEYSIFLGRYLISAVPGVCLLYAIALRGIASPAARVVAVVVIVLASLLTHERAHDDLRGASLAVKEFVGGDASIPILFATGLIEAQDETWLSNPAAADYLKAPIAYYPMDGRVVTLPRKLHGQPLASEIVDPILRRGQRFVVVEWYANGARIMPWLLTRAEAAGYRGVMKRGFGGVRVAFFRFVGGRSRK